MFHFQGWYVGTESRSTESEKITLNTLPSSCGCKIQKDLMSSLKKHNRMDRLGFDESGLFVFVMKKSIAYLEEGSPLPLVVYRK